MTAVLHRIIACLDDPDGDVRRQAIAVLKQVSSEALEGHVELLLSFTSFEKPWPVRMTGLYAFTCLPVGALIVNLDSILSSCLDDEESSSVRFAALDVLKALIEEKLSSSSSSLSPTAAAAGMEEPAGGRRQDDDDDAERQALESVLLKQAPKVIECFFDIEDRFVRWKAVSVLSSYPPQSIQKAPQFITDLVKGLTDFPLPCSRAACLFTLSRLHPSLLSVPVLKAMAGLLHDEENAVRWACCHGLKKVMPAMLGRDGDRGEVEAIIRKIGSKLSAGSEGEAVEREDVWVQREASRLIERLLPTGCVPVEVVEIREHYEEQRRTQGDDEDEYYEDEEGQGGGRYRRPD